MRKAGVTRRALLGGLGASLAGGALVKAQQDPFHDHSRVPAMDELKTAIEFEAVAFAKLPRETWTYTAYGAEGEFTLRRNRDAFDWVELVPRGVVDVSSVKKESAGEVLSEVLAEFLVKLGDQPRGLKHLGFKPEHINALVEGTLPQRRVLNLAPGLTIGDAETERAQVTKLFEEAMEY